MVLGETVGLTPNVFEGDAIGLGFSREHAIPRLITDLKVVSGRLVIKLSGIATMEDAEALIDQAIYLTNEQAGTVEDDRYAIGDIEGCTVVSPDGTTLGTISEVWLLPANDVWLLTQFDGHTIPLPVIESVIIEVDIAAKKVTANLLDGLDTIDRNTSEPSDA